MFGRKISDASYAGKNQTLRNCYVILFYCQLTNIKDDSSFLYSFPKMNTTL